MEKTKIAKIHTKFDLLGNLKSKYPNFLENYKERWVKILTGVTEDEIQGALYEYSKNIELKIIVNRRGCWKIVAYILVEICQNADRGGLYDTLKENETSFNDIFKENLNEEAREIIKSDPNLLPQLPEGDIIEIKKFEIEHINDNEQK
ncbi:MAG: hypothetical protein LBF69_01480 [Prevotellaceae bacterium]|jgi:hypothetical protein|nr:hypothetical protein [Prevotellaceae bacterium]